MSTETATDIAALVGEMEAPACELRQHGSHPIHTDAPASHYIRSLCPDCLDDSGVIAVCPGFVAAVKANAFGLCRPCGAEHHALDMVTILGPVTK